MDSNFWNAQTNLAVQPSDCIPNLIFAVH